MRENIHPSICTYFLAITVTLSLFKPCCKTRGPEAQWPESPGFKDQFGYGLKHNICFNFRENCKALRKPWEKPQKKGKIMDKGRTYSLLRERETVISSRIQDREALTWKKKFHPKEKTEQKQMLVECLAGCLLGFQAPVIIVTTDISKAENGDLTVATNHFRKLWVFCPTWPRSGFWIPYQGRQAHECSA